MNHPLNHLDASHDVDFLMGRWRIQNRKLPVVGGFNDGIGIFERGDELEG